MTVAFVTTSTNDHVLITIPVYAVNILEGNNHFISSTISTCTRCTGTDTASSRYATKSLSHISIFGEL